MEEQLLLPRLLAGLADLKSTQRRYSEAAALLDESTDLLEGLFTTASSPWTQSRLISGMDDVFLPRIRLEGAHGNVGRLFAAIELARGRPLLELLVNRAVSTQGQSQEYRAGERKIAALQRKLLQTVERRERRQLLDQIFDAEEQLAPISTAMFEHRRRSGPRTRIGLSEFQRALASDELFLQFALTEPHSYVIVATKSAARVQRLPGRDALRSALDPLLKKVRGGEDVSVEATALASLLLSSCRAARYRN
jgi:hypothetical protein